MGPSSVLAALPPRPPPPLSLSLLLSLLSLLLPPLLLLLLCRRRFLLCGAAQWSGPQDGGGGLVAAQEKAGRGSHAAASRAVCGMMGRTPAPVARTFLLFLSLPDLFRFFLLFDRSLDFDRSLLLLLPASEAGAGQDHGVDAGAGLDLGARATPAAAPALPGSPAPAPPGQALTLLRGGRRRHAPRRARPQPRRALRVQQRAVLPWRARGSGQAREGDGSARWHARSGLVLCQKLSRHAVAKRMRAPAPAARPLRRRAPRA
jgi:hypothetical protein